jgi:hypothetical protein
MKIINAFYSPRIKNTSLLFYIEKEYNFLFINKEIIKNKNPLFNVS